MRSPANTFITPSVASTTAAVAAAGPGLAADPRTPIVNSPSRDAYPIAGLTYLLVAVKAPHGAPGTKHFSSSSGPDFPGATEPSLKAVVKEAVLEQSAADFRQLQIQSGIALGVATVVALTLGWLVAGRILRPWTMFAWLAAGMSFMGVFERGPGAAPIRGDSETPSSSSRSRCGRSNR